MAGWPLWTAMGALVVFGLYVRVWGLWNFHLNPDEGLILLISSRPTLSEVLAAAAYEPHPPLSYITLHFMLYISDNLMFLRSIAYLPGVGLIPMLFLLGRRISGTAAGLAMATLVAFSHAAMMLSEVVRTYTLATFFVTVGLYAFFAYLQERRPKYLYLYSAAMTLGLLSHYFALLPVAAIGLVWLHRIARSRWSMSEAIRAGLANLPCAAVAIGSYVSHLSTRNGPHWWNNLDKGWLASQYPDGVSEIVVNAYKLFAYLFLPTNAWWLILLTVMGIAALWVAKHRDAAAVIVLTFTVNIVLAVADKYPFGGVRQEIFLLPLVLMSVGAAVQFGWDRAQSSINGTADSGFVWLASAHRSAISYVAMAVLVTFLGRVLYGITQSEFLRHYYGRGRGELPVMRDDLTGALRYLKGRMSTADILLADRQTTIYVRLANGQAPDAISLTVSKFSFNEFTLFYSNQNYAFSFDSEELLWESFGDLLHHVEIGDDITIWVISIGWPSIKRVAAGQNQSRLLVDRFSSGGAHVYSFRGSDVAAEVERRFGDKGVSPVTSSGTIS
jgi:hypothetical protein